MEKTKCFYCDNEATHTDTVKKGKRYIITDVCVKHLSMALNA